MAIRHGTALLWGVGVVGVSAAALIGAVGIAGQGGLTQDEVSRAIARVEGRETTGGTMHISPPRRLAADEAARDGLAADALVYPVRLDSAPAVGATPATYVVYRDGGGWSAHHAAAEAPDAR